MANREDVTRQLIERLHAMESDELQLRLKRGHFADHAVGLARAELIRRGLTPERLAVAQDEQASAESQDMVIIERRLNPVEANILQSALSANGVPAMVDDANAAHCLGYLAYALDGVRVRVPQSHVGRAREIIDDIAANRCMLDENDDNVAHEPDIAHQRLLAYTQDDGLARKWCAATPQMPGFMWSALLFGSIWFFYRKLYRTGAVLFAIESLLLFGIATSSLLGRTCMVMLLGMRVLIACTAEGLYYARSRTIIRRTASTHADELALREALRQSGGVSFPVALGALLAHRLLSYAF